MIVTLDAGHYGKYNQSPVNKNFYESDFTWKMCNYMAKFFKEADVKVRFTRSKKDVDKALFERGYYAKGSNIFLSIHANACDTERVDYPIVIRGYNEKETNKLALKLAEKIQEVMNTLQDGRTAIRKGKTGNEYYGVLRGAKAGNVRYRFIIEHSFYTNKEAVNFLLDDKKVEKLAKAEVDVILNYFNIKTQAQIISDRKHYVKVLVNDLNIRKIADWKASPIFTVSRGDIFTVIDTVQPKNGNTKMYKLKSGLYITACDKYVEDYYK